MAASNMLSERNMMYFKTYPDIFHIFIQGDKHSSYTLTYSIGVLTEMDMFPARKETCV